jgi:cytochrome P450
MSARGNTLPEILDKVVNHIKMFPFAGHDTTATTLAYAYLESYSNPAKPALLRAEHDSILGSDASQSPTRITADPAPLNQMLYTLVAVKEILCP